MDRLDTSGRPFPRRLIAPGLHGDHGIHYPARPGPSDIALSEIKIDNSRASAGHVGSNLEIHSRYDHPVGKRRAIQGTGSSGFLSVAETTMMGNALALHRRRRVAEVPRLAVSRC